MKIDMNDLEKYEPGLSKRLTIGGSTDDYKSYRIPIDGLFYNELNGRISTYEQEYDATHEVRLRDLLNKNLEEYNDVISKFIIDSADDRGKSYKHTRDDIKENGQRVPGVILTDGRIIDGNRRFTALRDLYQATGDQRFAYFECVVRPAPDEDDANGWKQIRLLELNLQFSEDEKKDYNPVEKVVNYYQSCVNPKTKVCEPVEYQKSSGMESKDFLMLQRSAKVMVDYLHWRGKDEMFYLVKQDQLDGPIKEIAGKLGKNDDWFFVDQIMDVRNKVYEYMTIVNKRSADRTREVRKLIESARSGGALYDVYLGETSGDSETVKTIARAIKLKDEEPSTPAESEEKREVLAEAGRIVKDAYNSGYIKQTTEEKAVEPINILKSCIDELNKIKPSEVNSFPDSRKEKFHELLDKIAELIDSIDNGTK